jgi:hypothetical protein
MQVQNLKNKLPTINLWIHIVGGLCIFALIFYNYSKITNLEKRVFYLSNKLMTVDNQFVDYIATIPPNDTPYTAYEQITYEGVIRKEEIPEEYALGEYWYIFYFDKPQIIQTAAGDREVTNLEIQASTIDSFDGYLDKQVQIKGRLSWGYAESRIILADEVNEL